MYTLVTLNSFCFAVDSVYKDQLLLNKNDTLTPKRGQRYMLVDRLCEYINI